MTRKSGARIAHIGIAVAELDRLLPFYRDLLGLPEQPLADSDGAHIVGLRAGETLIELLAATDPDSPITKFLAKRGPGIHHICFAVDDLDATIDRCILARMNIIDAAP